MAALRRRRDFIELNPGGCAAVSRLLIKCAAALRRRREVLDE
jgi:hypothetical protein